MAITTKVVRVTPPMAKEMLSHNSNNRKVNDFRHIDAMARDMRDGNWQLNGESIVFDDNGVLKDGQHRLMAVVKSGCTVDMMITTGVSKDITLYDRGKNRSIADTLHFEGIDLPNRAKVVPVAKSILVMTQRKFTPSDHELVQTIIDEFEPLQFVAKLGKGGAGCISLNAATRFALYCAYKEGEDPEVIKRFADAVTSGFIDSQQETSAIVLRNMILAKLFKCPGDLRGVGAQELLKATEQAFVDFKNGTKRQMRYKTNCGYKYFVLSYLIRNNAIGGNADDYA